MNTTEISILHTEKPQSQNGLDDITWFFVKELRSLAKKFPEVYDDKFLEEYLVMHAWYGFALKIKDSKRFFRIIKNTKWDIIWYFESKQNGFYADTQTVQWILVDPEYRWKGIARKLWNEFESWCQENHYVSVWSFAAIQNTVSESMHKTLMDNPMMSYYSDDTYIFVAKIPI